MFLNILHEAMAENCWRDILVILLRDNIDYQLRSTTKISMDLVTPVISTIASLIDIIATRLRVVMDVDQSVQTLKIALNELNDAVIDLDRRVDQAESAGLTCTSQVKGWLDRAKAIESEVSLLINDVRPPRQCFWCCNTNCLSRCKLSENVQQKLRDISLHMEKKSLDLPVADGSRPVAVLDLPTRPTFGLDIMLEKVEEFIREDDVGIIGIYGMGGVGKTTLLKKINNNFLTAAHDFDVVIWVLVSKDFVVERIQQVIGLRLGLSWDESEFQEQRDLKLYNVMRRKKFMLLLDDVWEGLDLETIGIPIPDKVNKCKVVFTTRSMDVCNDMDAHRKLKVEFLKERESWELFYEKVGRSDLLKLEPIQTHAAAIIRKCGGLPLALITIGRAMANKKSEKDWKCAVDMLNRYPSKLRGMEDVFSLLRFSFVNLNDDITRICFLYCSLFPEGYSIEKEQLIEYWIAEGFLDSFHDRDVHNIGHALIESLKDACFLETGEDKTQVKMHDVVRSLALWIVSDFGHNEKNFLTQASLGLTESPNVEEWEGAQRISLLDNGINELSEIPVCPNLLTLLLQWNSGLSKISNGFFQFMPTLRVLDLSFTSLRDIPVSVSQLVELRHLDLSGTKLSTLPEEIGGLKKLRYLDLQRTLYLKTIPREAISGLTQLRVLNLYYSYGGWEVQDWGSEIKVNFADLECLRHLTSVGITVTELTTLKKLSGFNILLNCIQYLYIKDCEGLFHLQLSSTRSDGERLRRLSIYKCCDLKYLTIGVGAGENWLPSLEFVALHDLPNLITVWRNPVTQGALHNLRSINIWYCNKLKNVSWILRLPKLEVLYLFYCKAMEEVISGDEAIEQKSNAFLCLKTVSIRDLPELRSFTQQAMAFPSLERIAVIACPKLKKLPMEVSNTLTPPTMYGSKDWWDKLEWDDDSTKSAFLPQFIAT